MIKLNNIAVTFFLLVGHSFGLISSQGETDNEVSEISSSKTSPSVSNLLKSCLRKESKYKKSSYSGEKNFFKIFSPYSDNDIATINRYKNGAFTSRSVDAIEYVQSKNRGELNSVGLCSMINTVTQIQRNDMFNDLPPDQINSVIELLKIRKNKILSRGTSKK